MRWTGTACAADTHSHGLHVCIGNEPQGCAGDAVAHAAGGLEDAAEHAPQIEGAEYLHPLVRRMP